MPEYLSPGVYVEEVDTGAKPIEGVSTSTTGAVGVCERGPTAGKPLLVTSFADFVRNFGGYLAEPESGLFNSWALNQTEGGRWWQFPLAVKGFFDNGGQRLYVKRVSSGTAQSASATLGRGMISEILQDVPAASRELRLRHIVGISNGANVRIFASGVSIGAFQVTSYTGTGVVVLNNAVGQDLKGGRDFVQIIARAATAAGPPDESLLVRAKASGDWGGNEISDNGIVAGTGLRIRIRPMVGATLKAMGDPVLGGSPATTATIAPANAGDQDIQVGSVAGFANGNTVKINAAKYGISNVTQASFTIPALAVGPLPIGTLVSLVGGTATTRLIAVANQTDTRIVVASVAGFANNDNVQIAGVAGNQPIANVTLASMRINPVVPANATWPVGTPINRFRPANNTTTPAAVINLQNASQLYPGALLEFDNGTQKETRVVDSVTGDQVTVAGGNLANAYFDGDKVRVVEVEVSVRFYRQHIITAEEVFTNLRLVDDGGMNYLVRQVNENSTLVDLVAGADFPGSVDTLQEFPSLPPPANVGDPQLFWLDLTGGRDNLQGLTVDDFVGVDGGSDNRTGIQALEDIDEVSICLAPGMWSSTVQSALIIHCETLKDRFAILDPRDGLSIEGIREVREVLDSKYAALYYPWIEVRDPSVKRNVYVAPSGHMAGIYARVDVERGVHKAPANEVIRGITKIAQDVTKREQDMLNPKGINALRFFPGRGNRVWGARTISSDASWKYINVRRLFIFVEESIDEGTQFVVFEPNDEPLWARVRQTIDNFLTTVWRSGALQGATAGEAFFVKCDHTTMTQDDIDNGRLICVIGIAPVKPAEFVIFRIQQKTLESKS